MKIKNLKFVKAKVIPLLLAGTISTVGLTGCNGTVNMSDITFGQLLEISDVKDNTLMDELLEQGGCQFEEDMTYLEAADLLIRYMDIVEKLDKINFDGVSELRKLTDAEYIETLDYTDEDIDLLIETIKKAKMDDLVDEENKLTAYKKLNFLNDYCNEFIHENGERISERVMLLSVKTAVADELDLPVDEIGSITIPKSNGNSEPESYAIDVNDKRYYVPLNSEEMWNTINYIYQLQSANLTDKTEKETYRKAINYAKTTMAAGVNIKGNKIKIDHNAHEIQENYLGK